MVLLKWGNFVGMEVSSCIPGNSEDFFGVSFWYQTGMHAFSCLQSRAVSKSPSYCLGFTVELFAGMVLLQLSDTPGKFLYTLRCLLATSQAGHVMLVGLKFVSAGGGGGGVPLHFYGSPCISMSYGPSLLRVPPPPPAVVRVAQHISHHRFVGFYDSPDWLFLAGTLSWMIFFLPHRESLLSAVANSLSPRSK